jgi:hypothetical protein
LKNLDRVFTANIDPSGILRVLDSFTLFTNKSGGVSEINTTPSSSPKVISPEFNSTVSAVSLVWIPALLQHVVYRAKAELSTRSGSARARLCWKRYSALALGVPLPRGFAMTSAIWNLISVVIRKSANSEEPRGSTS